MQALYQKLIICKVGEGGAFDREATPSSANGGLRTLAVDC